MLLIFSVTILIKKESIRMRDKRFDDYLIVKLSKQLKQQAIERAESKYSTLSDYLRGLIVKDLEERK
jgi:hypothetical protein